MQLPVSLSLAIVMAAASASPAFAQNASGSAAGSVSPRWTVEGYGGISFGRFSRGGETSLPPAGAPITTSSPVFPSWSVPSWFFGDGAAFLNNVAAEFGATSRITPLDGILRPLGLNDAGHVVAGVRVRGPIRGAYELEVALELTAQPVSLSGDLTDALAGAADSFRATFTELLATGPLTSPIVTAGSSVAAGTSRDLLLTAALSAPGGTFGSFSSYGVVGGGILLPMGDASTAALTGRYRFQIAGTAPVDESDQLTVRYRERTSFVGLFGGGVRRAFSARAGLSLDARILIGRQSTAVEVDASPTIVTGTPAAFIESFTYPNLQFSNNASTGRRSTLGGPGLDAVNVFEGGWMIRGRLTAGIYLRF
jgi:hypothetical protein